MSRYNTFFVPHGDDGEAQKRLNDFLGLHRVCKVEKAVLEEGWTFCVEWLAGDGPAPLGRRGGGVEKIDYMKVLPPEVFARFAKLRERRREIAREAKVNAYIVATDAQLAEIARIESPRLEDLRALEGFGDFHMANYAARLLGVEDGSPGGLAPPPRLAGDGSPHQSAEPGPGAEGGT